jgi:hypothetical protein
LKQIVGVFQKVKNSQTYGKFILKVLLVPEEPDNELLQGAIVEPDQLL